MTTPSDTNNDERNNGKLVLLDLNIHQVVVEDMQQGHGVSHDDYKQYHAYCTRRLSRLRHNPIVRKELVHSMKYGGKQQQQQQQQQSNQYTKRSRHMFCPRTTISDVTKSLQQQQMEEPSLYVEENAEEGEEQQQQQFITSIPDNYIWFLLVSSERAWAHANQLFKQQQQEITSSSTNHGLRRLYKAKQWAMQLQDLAKVSCTKKTQMECDAYAAWIKGSYALEKGHYKTASSELANAITLCHELSTMHGLVDMDSKQDEELVLKQKHVAELFLTRAETIYRPLFRYCQYQLLEAGEEPTPEPMVEHTASTNSKRTDPSISIHYRGHALELNDKTHKELCVLLFKFQSTTTNSSGGVVAGAGEVKDNQDASTKDEESFYQSLSILDDALSLVQKWKQRAANNATSAITSNEWELWNAYLTYQKIQLIMDHTEQMGLQANNNNSSTGPAEFVHVYDLLLKHAQSILELPRPKGTTISDDQDDEEDEFALQIQAIVLRLRALKCYHMAWFYYSTSSTGSSSNNSKQEDPCYKAWALIHHSQSLTKRALEEIMACDQDSMHRYQEYITELEEYQSIHIPMTIMTIQAALTIRRCTSSSTKNSTSSSSQETKHPDGDGETITTTNLQNTNRCLLLRLNDFDSGKIVNDNDENKSQYQLADVPLAYMPIPCKPVFYDLAFDTATDLITPTHVLEQFVSEHEQGQQNTKSSKGGWLGWLTG